MRSILVLLAAALAACGSEASVDAVDTVDTVDTVDSAGAPEGTTDQPAPWRRLDPPPLTARSGAAIGWTGDEIIVVGGSTFLCPPGAHCGGPSEPPFRDGAALDPASGAWRPIADAPMPVSSHQATAHLDGDVYVLVTPWDSARPQATLLRYQADVDAWATYEVPTGAHVGGLLAAGHDLIVYPGSDESGETPDLSFDPRTEIWTELPRDPLSPSFDRLYAWTADGLHLFAKEITPSPGGASGPALTEAAVLDDGTWRELPTGEAIGFWAVIADGDRIVSPELGCGDGGEVNGYGRCIPNGAVFDTASGTWSELADAPSRGDEHVSSSGAFTAEQVLLTSTGDLVLDLTADQWLRMPRIDDERDGTTVERTISGAGPYGFAFGGARFAPGDHAGELLGDAWLWTPSSGDRSPG